VIFSTCPSPTGGGPNPTLETYRFPSGPKVMAVGNDRADVVPLAISVYWFLPSTRKIFAVLAVGNGFVAHFHFATGGRLIRIASIFPPVFSPKRVPRS